VEAFIVRSSIRGVMAACTVMAGSPAMTAAFIVTADSIMVTVVRFAVVVASIVMLACAALPLLPDIGALPMEPTEGAEALVHGVAAVAMAGTTATTMTAMGGSRQRVGRRM
jgi:hypothetical protein